MLFFNKFLESELNLNKARIPIHLNEMSRGYGSLKKKLETIEGNF